jgi:glycerate kinase
MTPEPDISWTSLAMTRMIRTIAIAPDSFKGAFSAADAATYIERGLRRALPRLSIRKIPMADGGEGTVRAIVDATGGSILTRTVKNPLARPVKATFGMTGDGTTAVIEMAAASGLALLKPRDRNPLRTTTYGTGQLIAAALTRKARKILVGIGGSATNDGGMGMARALGVKFLDRRGREIPEGGGALHMLDRIDLSKRHPRVAATGIEVACDVDNPLVGPRGAACVYSPQKGATPQMVRKLDDGLRHLAGIIKRDLGVSVLRIPGSGAAGGLGAGLMAFLGARLRPGVDIVIDTVGLKRQLRGCDLVITGEGRMDGQTIFGKTPAGVARAAKQLGLPVIAICGSLGKDVGKVHSVGIDAYFSALESPTDEQDLPRLGPAMLVNCAEQVARLMMLTPGKQKATQKRRGSPKSGRRR